MEAFAVTLDGVEHRFFPGATVRDLAGRLDAPLRAAYEAGRLEIVDATGSVVGSGGAIAPGGAYRTLER